MIQTPDWLVTIVKKDGQAVVKLFLLDGKNRKKEVELNLTDFYDNKLHEYFMEVAKSVTTSVGGYFLNKNETEKK